MIDRREEQFVAEGLLLTDVGGTLPAKVLSTPGMIGVMERCSAMLALEHTPEGRPTVGFEVCVKHVAGAFEGAQCTVTSTLVDIADERKYRFEVEVRSEDRVLGVGTHERRLLPGT